MLEAPAFVAGLHDVAMMREAKDARPFAEGEIVRDDDRGALIDTADQVEQKLSASLGRVTRATVRRHAGDQAGGPRAVG